MGLYIGWVNVCIGCIEVLQGAMQNPILPDFVAPIVHPKPDSIVGYDPMKTKSRFLDPLGSTSKT